MRAVNLADLRDIERDGVLRKLDLEQAAAGKVNRQRQTPHRQRDQTRYDHQQRQPEIPVAALKDVEHGCSVWPQMPNQECRAEKSTRSRNRCKTVRVTRTAVNKLTTTPSARVSAKPLTRLAPKVLPNQYRMAQVISVEIFESRMEGQARLKPASTAWRRTLPDRSSSFIRSKIRMLASTATPTDKTKPAMPGKVRVTGMRMNSANVM